MSVFSLIAICFLFKYTVLYENTSRKLFLWVLFL